MINKKQADKNHYPAMMRLAATLLFIPIMLMLSSAQAQDYSKTIEALEQRYAEEVLAHRKYMAYSNQACSEGYPNIAHLFKSLASSEGIHARNFSDILASLGVKPDAKKINGKIKVKSTKYNLKHAVAVERQEIDKEYPKILASIRPEKHQQAISSINFAWKAEQQHSDLLIKLQRAGTTWFGLIVDKIEGAASHYHVCQVCGSTLNVMPKGKCPICGSHVSQYRVIAPLPVEACPKREKEEDNK